MQKVPEVRLPTAFTEQGIRAFTEKWDAFQSFDGSFLYEQALVRWAHQLNSHFDSEVGSLFLASVANRSAGEFDASTVHFSRLPSLSDFRLVLSTFRGPNYYDERTIRNIQTSMASLLLAGLERFQRDLQNKTPLATLLQDEALPPPGEWDNASVVYRLRNAEAKQYRGAFLRLNLESFPVGSLVEIPLAQMDSAEADSPLGAFIEIPSDLADSMASDIVLMRKWLKSYIK